MPKPDKLKPHIAMYRMGACWHWHLEANGLVLAEGPNGNHHLSAGRARAEAEKAQRAMRTAKIVRE